MIRPLLMAIAGLAIAAPAASAHDDVSEIFATGNPAVITDQHDDDREFVSAATDGRARIEKRALVLAAGDGDDVVALRDGRRVQIDFGNDDVIDFEVRRGRFDRVRVEGEGQDRLIVVGTGHGDDYDTSDYSGAEVLELDTGDGRDSVIARQGPQEIEVDPGPGDDRVVVNSTNDDEQSVIMGFGDTVFVIADPFVSIQHADPTDRLRLNGRGGDDLLSASTDAMKITLSAGDGGGTMFGGPGDDVLLGGGDFDLVEGNEGDDVIDLGGGSDSVTWRAGDGDDRIDGGGGPRNGMWVIGSDADETFDFRADGHRLRIGGDASLDVTGIEAFDVLVGSGADVTRVGDLRSAGVTDIHTSLAATVITAGGDNSPDRVELAGAHRAATVTGQGGAATVTGLPVRLQISHSDGLLDTLAISGAGSIDRSGLPDGVIAVETG